MRGQYSLGLAAFGLALSGLSAAALAAGADAWMPAIAPNGAFSVQTPCTPSEVAALQHAPTGLAFEFSPRSQVLCRKGKLLFLAGEVESKELPSGYTSLVDLISAEALKDKTAEGAPMRTVLNGRRAFVNRQESHGVVAQTGFVEISKTKVVLLTAGGQSGSGLGVKAQDEAIARFYRSIKVTGK